MTVYTTPQSPGTAGAAPTYRTPQAGGDRVPCGVRLFIKNGATASQVTLATPLVVDTLALADRVITLAASSETFVDVPTSLYADPADGLCGLSWTSVATVTFAILGAQPS